MLVLVTVVVAAVGWSVLLELPVRVDEGVLRLGLVAHRLVVLHLVELVEVDLCLLLCDFFN